MQPPRRCLCLRLFFLLICRALGDFEYKNVDGKGPTEQLVSPEPEFYVKTRDADNDEFLVLACDGVWDVMTNEDICSFIADRMRVTDDLETIANEVIDTCLHKVSHGWVHKGMAKGDGRFQSSDECTLKIFTPNKQRFSYV